MISSSKPAAAQTANTLAEMIEAFIKPSCFREYDFRGKIGADINLLGFRLLGQGLGTQLKRKYPAVANPTVVVGHDYRSYAPGCKHAVVSGLMNAGCTVVDIGLALSPTAYWAQVKLNTHGVAMITASHNPNGWAGVKMGLQPRLTHHTAEMEELKNIVLNGESKTASGGSYSERFDMAAQYKQSFTELFKPFTHPLKVVVACGNGTAGAFVPEVLRNFGVDVIERHCTPDYTFPHFNPDPENMVFMNDLGTAVRENNADIGLAFDGDGDRIGVVGKNGEPVFNDKIGLIIARYLAKKYVGAKFVVDVKSTGLFSIDPLINTSGGSADYWKTGHSHIKRRVAELKALAGFEKSGHFFFAPPVGEGYDDAVLSALWLLHILNAQNTTLEKLLAELPTTHQTPSYHPTCADDVKYGVVEKLTTAYQQAAHAKENVAGQPIAAVITVNGVRVVLADGTWGLIRASSNIPSLVVVAESPTSAHARDAMGHDLQTRMAKFPEIGMLNDPNTAH